jgi:hypothetical protein
VIFADRSPRSVLISANISASSSRMIRLEPARPRCQNRAGLVALLVAV